MYNIKLIFCSDGLQYSLIAPLPATDCIAFKQKYIFIINFMFSFCRFTALWSLYEIIQDL